MSRQRSRRGGKPKPMRFACLSCKQPFKKRTSNPGARRRCPHCNVMAVPHLLGVGQPGYDTAADDGPVTRTTQYAAYMNSPEWFARREKTLERDGYCCRACLLENRARPATQVHHISYQLVFHEPIKDLLSLCGSCHEAEHKNFSLRRREPFWRENTASMMTRGRRAATTPASRRLRPFVPPAPAKGVLGRARIPSADRGDLQRDPAGTPEPVVATERRDDVRRAVRGASRLEHGRSMPQPILPVSWLWEATLPVSRI